MFLQFKFSHLKCFGVLNFVTGQFYRFLRQISRGVFNQLNQLIQLVGLFDLHSSIL